MEWFFENWRAIILLAVGVLGFGVFVGFKVSEFIRLTPEEQKKKISVFLLGLMVQAEATFQTAEGQARLQTVLKEFYANAPLWMQKAFTYTQLVDFANWVFKQNKEIIESVNQVKNQLGK